jgi:hypothetical protein
MGRQLAGCQARLLAKRHCEMLLKSCQTRSLLKDIVVFELGERVFPLIVSDRDATRERQDEIKLNAERCWKAQRLFLQQTLAAMQSKIKPSDIALWPEMESARTASRLRGSTPPACYAKPKLAAARIDLR